jgi:hypothetical protein
MSAFLDVSDWNFRVYDKRLVVVKTKNESAGKVSFLDVLTNLSLTVGASNGVSLQVLTVGKEYLANLRVYTSKNVDGVKADFTDFFEAIDIDQGIEDFIRAYWIYPNKIRFELVSVEEP